MAYRRALEIFGVETQDFKITDNISSFMEWLHSELKLLPDTSRKPHIHDHFPVTIYVLVIEV
jgi:hypothetical protein